MLKQKKYFLFDIDGTLAVDTTLYEGTKDMIRYIESIHGKAFYITNNSTKSRRDYVKKFEKWNIKTTEDQFVTASYATCLYLKRKYGHRKLFVLGTPSFVQELKEYGLTVTELAEEDVACVVVGFDETLRYEKVQVACELLFRPEVDYVGTNPDLRCPTAFGFIPDCGGICEMINCTVDRMPFYVGKPNEIIVDLCLQQVNGKKEEAIVVGDRLYTDIACGINSNVDTAVVFSGEASREDMETAEYQATYQYDTILEFYHAIISE